MCSVHPLDEKSTTSNCTIEINGLDSSCKCQMLCSTRVESPGRLSSTVPMPIIAHCCEFLARIESECRAEYCQNCDI